MQISDIVKFWGGEQAVDGGGRWAHRLDRARLDSEPNTFNLDHPVSPYIGDVLAAPVIILNANAGYSSVLTPTEFSDVGSAQAYVSRVDNPGGADWSFVSRYYNDTNYGHLVASGRAVVVNACAYRSPKIRDEPDNRAMITRLPSCVFTRRWLIEAVLPTARAGERLIVVNRGGQWKLPAAFYASPGVVRDPAPVSARITGAALVVMSEFLSAKHWSSH
jgi:hypothetical protein